MAPRTKVSTPATGVSSGSAVRTVAPAIPLALALLHTAVIAPANKTPEPAVGPPAVATDVVAVKCGEGIENYLACHSSYPTGCSASGKYDPELNLFKNQMDWGIQTASTWYTSLDQVVALEAQLPSGLAAGNHASYVSQLGALGEGTIHGVVGYLYAVKTESSESSNCELAQTSGPDGDENVDFHIYIGFDPAVAGRLKSKTATPADKLAINPKSMIVEMTPQIRGQVHPEWTLASLKAIVGEQVRIQGQLMVDNEHYLPAQDCGRADHTSKCWRGTVWELHPVTDFEVCDSSGSCDVNTGGWKPLGAN